MFIKELRRSIRLGSAQALTWGLRAVPEPWGRSICAGIGRAAHTLVGRDRRLARGNLARVHPDWTRERVHGTAREVFLELGRNGFDFLRYPSLSPEARDRLVRVPQREALEAPRREGTGAILVTGHLGCWEILAATLVRLGLPFKAMARPLREPRLEAALRRHRLRMGVETLSSEGLPLAALRHLKQGGYLGILADQRVHRGGIRVRFLGQPTLMTEGPARLALSAGVPIIPFGIHRQGSHAHEVRVLESIPPQGSVAGVTQRIAEGLERLIGLSPEQWMWIHPRWEPMSEAETWPDLPVGDTTCAPR